MPLEKALSRLKRLAALGPRGCINAARRRGRQASWRILIRNQRFIRSWRGQETASCLNKTQLIFLKKLTQGAQQLRAAGNNGLDHEPELIRSAQTIVAKKFTILGATSAPFTGPIDWHRDFKLDAHPAIFTSVNQSLRYAAHRPKHHFDVPMHQPPRNDFDSYFEDVKTIWDLSRLQHLAVLGQAHTLTRDERFAEAIAAQSDSWLEANPYPRGINWKCPMDIGIRAINLIWALGFTAGSRSVSHAWQGKILISLQHHAEYLSWNWEESDRPNNHYLADLVGYLFICLLFQDQPHFAKQIAWTLDKIEDAFMHQILPDGTAYEGSTAYHRLDTELLLQARAACDAANVAFPKALGSTLEKMFTFLQDCTDQGGNFVKIGDDDGGSIVFGLQPLNQTKDFSTIYPDFGLYIQQNSRMHVTLRGARLLPHQPSGHAHHDELAFTLSIDGQPIIVDPGSFIYTGNPAWRNRMRSFSSHSTFFPVEWEELCNASLCRSDLFQTPMRRHVAGCSLENGTAAYTVRVKDSPVGLMRRLNIYAHQIEIEDHLTTETNIPAPLCTWNFILHPAIVVKKIDPTHFLLSHKIKGELALLQSELPLEIVKNKFYAPTYGVIEQTSALTAQGTNFNTKTVITCF